VEAPDELLWDLLADCEHPDSFGGARRVVDGMILKVAARCALVVRWRGIHTAVSLV